MFFVSPTLKGAKKLFYVIRISHPLGLGEEILALVFAIDFQTLGYILFSPSLKGAKKLFYILEFLTL